MTRPEYEGGAEMACPDCGGMLTTQRALYKMQIENGIRFVGVPCDKCAKTFTVEMTKDDQ
jgi:C4-type Zn-finger protein